MIQQALVLMLVLGTGACTRVALDPLPEALARLEYLVLSKPVPGSSRWLLAGRFETTRGEYGNVDREGDEDLPVTMVSFLEAEAWCRQRRLHLPTLAEWRHLATSGREEFLVADTARNGLDLGLNRVLPVGVFERGRTALGAYDFLGNVREWAVDPAAERFFACGGSFAAREAGTHPNTQLELSQGDRAEDIGFRYFANATEYLLEEVVPRWADLEAGHREQVLGFMAAWRPESRMAVAAILRRRGAPEAFCTQLAQA